MDQPNTASSTSEENSAPIPVAVIDVGTTSIRMAVAEIDAASGVRRLDTLSQAVNLGKDTFTTGSISKETVESCVRVLRIYRQKLQEYQIFDSKRIRIIATSAVREARNRLAFLDRIYIGTGFQITPIDEADVNRITYLGILPYLQAEPALAVCKTIVIEVGGGSMELLLVKNNNVSVSHSYRLGSLRLRETCRAFRAPANKVRGIMEGQIQNTIDQIREEIASDGKTEMIAIGGDMRFATAHLMPDWSPATMARLPVGALEQLTDDILALSEDEIVSKYHLSYPDAETVGPALLVYLELAKAFKLVNVLVTNTNLRDGLLQEMALRGAWTLEFRNQIIRSAITLGRRYDFDEDHARHVAESARSLFEQLRAEHRLPDRYEIILYVAALLHEIGRFVGPRSMHKHSMYLIRNSEIFGLGKQNLLLAALVARYHRRATPQPTHEPYAELSRDERAAVSTLAAILRVGLALDESRSQRIKDFQTSIDRGRFVISVPQVDDLSLEQLALRQNSVLFESVFGYPVLLRSLTK